MNIPDTALTPATQASRPVDAAWAPDLRPALEHHGIHVRDELMLSELITDLSAAATAP
ncbi:DUF2399 domain-containing protein [Kibdelosporangium philippinense]|uniref:DUF2399 domain-containing protein n=1 Tax=Kibdelosporangium philippinense TaxID=211113 RepID=UPI0020223012|nr:DUF2399 domain-containing protein [Kibdelosporangium philippinense]